MPTEKSSEPSGYYYPNNMGRIVLQALEEVMGRNGVNALLTLAKLRHLVNNFPPNNLEKGFPFRSLIRESASSPVFSSSP